MPGTFFTTQERERLAGFPDDIPHWDLITYFTLTEHDRSLAHMCRPMSVGSRRRSLAREPLLDRVLHQSTGRQPPHHREGPDVLGQGTGQADAPADG
jgi:hypothetical protein